MSRLRIVQFSCLAVAVIGGIVMTCHLFMDNGITHPTHVLTVSAAVIFAGLVGNAVCALIRYEQETKRKNQ